MADFECYRRKRNAYLESVGKRGHLRDEYQDEETKADPRHGRAIIKKIREENGIDVRIPADAPEYQDVFLDLLSDDRGGAILYEDYLDKLSEMVGIAENETAERRASSSFIMKKIFDDYFRPEVDLELRRNVIGAYLEYNFSVELICRKLSYIRTACMYYGIWLVKDIPVDRMIAEKIKEILDISCDTYEDKLPLSQIPGFYVDEYGKADPESFGKDPFEVWSDYESIMMGIKEVRAYTLRHPQQVDVQCLMSIVTGTEELKEVSSRAALLDLAIDRYTISDAGRNLDGPSWQKLFNGWVMVKSFLRVVRVISRFVGDYKNRTVGEATDALDKLLPFISYALVERNIRLALRQITLEGGIYEFELSKVKITDAVRKASSSFRCVSFSDAFDKTKKELFDIIKKEKRIIPLAEDFAENGFQEKQSFICIKEGKPCGAAFVSMGDETPVLDLIYAVDNMAIAALVVNTFDQALKEYGPDTKITIPVISERSSKLIEKFVPGVKIRRLITALKR